MYIGLNDMDPHLAEAFSNQIGTLLYTTQPAEEQKRLRTLLEKRAGARSWWQLGLAFGSFPFIIAGTLFESNPLAMLGFWSVGLAATAGSFLVARRTPDFMTQLRQSITAEEMSVVFPHLTLTRAEQIYTECLFQLASLKPGAEDTALRDLLPQLNTLVAQSRLLDEQQKSVLAAIGTHSAAALELEHADLTRRTIEAEDAVVQEAMQQSLRLCDSRLENARAFDATLKRLTAQQEVITQTLSSVQSSLARRQVAPAPLAAPEVADIQQAVVRINTQTQSIEQAVQEVIALRAE